MRKIHLSAAESPRKLYIRMVAMLMVLNCLGSSGSGLSSKIQASNKKPQDVFVKFGPKTIKTTKHQRWEHK